MDGKTLGRVFYKSGYYTVMHDGFEHAGYLAFLTLLSIFPFLVFVFSVAGTIGNQEIGAGFLAEFQEFLPDDVALALLPRINEILSGPPQSLLTLAIIGMVWTASSAVEGVRTILNRAYRVTNPPVYIYRRLMSMLEFLILSTLVIVGMFFLTFAPSIWDSLQRVTDFQLEIHPDWVITRYYISAAVIFLSIAISYYALPNIKQTWKSVLPGSIIVTMLWLGFAYLFSSYISYYRQFNIVYGSLAGIIISLLFFYVLAIIYIFGAEFNYFFEKAIGYKFVEKEPAVEVKAKKKSSKANSGSESNENKGE